MVAELNHLDLGGATVEQVGLYMKIATFPVISSELISHYPTPNNFSSLIYARYGRSNLQLFNLIQSICTKLYNIYIYPCNQEDAGCSVIVDPECTKRVENGIIYVNKLQEFNI